MILGRRIQERLHACGISQAELGRRVKLNQSTINGLIRGDQQSTTKLHQIARELRTTPAYLTGETDTVDGEAASDQFTSDERALIEHLRLMGPEDRRAFYRIAMLAARPAGETLHDSKHAYRGE